MYISFYQFYFTNPKDWFNTILVEWTDKGTEGENIGNNGERKDNILFLSVFNYFEMTRYGCPKYRLCQVANPIPNPNQLLL